MFVLHSTCDHHSVQRNGPAFDAGLYGTNKRTDLHNICIFDVNSLSLRRYNLRD